MILRNRLSTHRSRDVSFVAGEKIAGEGSTSIEGETEVLEAMLDDDVDQLLARLLSDAIDKKSRGYAAYWEAPVGSGSLPSGA